jgi:metallo-beta-lactamase family protein
MKIQFLGADRQVTGSRHLLRTKGSTLLVDCGLFQERPYLDRNWDPFPFPPKDIDSILLTHAHLDHCGAIPRLVKEGFRGAVLATAPTIDLARIVLLDSAHIMEEDAAFKKKRHAKEGRSGPHPEVPLYTVDDARRSFELFEPVSYLEPVTLEDGTTVRFHDAGHILGSSMLSLETAGPAGSRRKLVFSGDVGQWNRPLIHDPSVFAAADYVVMESTYGDRNHEDPRPIDDLLAAVIGETAARGGNLVIPVFALERAQELLYYIGELVRAGRVPRLPVYLDSPMAVEVTGVFARYPGDLDPEAAKLVADGARPFDFPGLRLVTKTEESKAINRIPGPCIILAGSGMCTGGRIKHHLAANISRPECTVLFVGYQARDTLGRQILEGGRAEVRINGQLLAVRARIARIHGFSGHAGRDDLLRWLGAFKVPPRRLFLVHGDEEVALGLAAFLGREKSWEITVPRYLEEFDLG